jgi:hypothetical protein
MIPRRVISAWQRAHEASHLQGLKPIAPAKIAFDTRALKSLLKCVRCEHTKDHRHTRLPGNSGHTFARLRYHYIEMRSIPADHGTKRNDGVIAPSCGQALSRQWDLKTTRHPHLINLLAISRGVKTMAVKTIQTALEQLAGDQVVESRHHNSQSQIGKLLETSFKDSQLLFSAIKLISS